MKIYQLIVNRVESEPRTMIPSNYSSPRTPQKVEYYLNKASAEKRSSEIYEGVKKLAGFIDNMEVEIRELTVIE